MSIQSLIVDLIGIGAVCIIGAWLIDRRIDGMGDSARDSSVTHKVRMGLSLARKVAMVLGFSLLGVAIGLIVLGL